MEEPDIMLGALSFRNDASPTYQELVSDLDTRLSGRRNSES